MATRYHINPQTGSPGRCDPKVTGVCKYGSDNPHYESEGAAREAFEAEMSGSWTTGVQRVEELRDRADEPLLTSPKLDQLKKELSDLRRQQSLVGQNRSMSNISDYGLQETLKGAQKSIEADLPRVELWREQEARMKIYTMDRSVIRPALDAKENLANLEKKRKRAAELQRESDLRRQEKEAISNRAAAVLAERKRHITEDLGGDPELEDRKISRQKERMRASI